MGILSWIGERRSEKALRGSPAVVEALAARRVSPYPAIGGTNLNVAQIARAYETMQNAAYSWIYSEQPAVRSVIDYIARNAAQLGPPRLYERAVNGDANERPSHPAMETLRDPQMGTVPGGHLMLTTLSNFLVYDNAYNLKFRTNPDSPLVLLDIPPHCVSVVGQEKFTIEGYNVYRADGTYFFVEPENMIHWRGYNADDPRMGFSRLETLREILAEEMAMQAASIELAKSGLAVAGHIERPLDAPDWTPEARKRFESDWAARYADKNRETPVLEEGMEFKPATMTSKDAEVLKSRQFGREEVAGLYGMKNVPPEGEDEQQQFYTDVLAPLFDQYCWFLNTSLLQVEFDEPNMYFAVPLDEKLQTDDKIKTLVSASGGPVLTRNESRRKLNLGPVPGGNELITPLNVTVGGKPSPQVMPPQDPNGPSQDGDHREAHLTNGRKRLEEIEVGLGESDTVEWDQHNEIAEVKFYPPNADHVEIDRKRLEEDNVKAERQLLARRAAQEKRRDEYEAELLEMLIRNFDRLDRAAKDAENHNKAPTTAPDQTKAINWSKWVKRLQQELLALAKRIVAREGGINSVRFGAEDIDMSRAENWLVEMSKEKSDAIGNALRDALENGNRATVLDQARNDAGPRAAATLATALSSFATHEAADQSPDRSKRTKTWVVHDVKTSAHPEMDGETVALGKKFSNGRKGPPFDHPGCKCLLEIN